MIYKNIFLAISLIFSVACSSCGPAELKTELDKDTEVAEQYPFATWEECGQNDGDHPCNFTLEDQNGNDISLYDYYGDTIVLDLSAAWCGPCNMAATEVQSVADELKDEGFVYITVLIENSAGEPPSQQDCKNWADMYGITEPVLRGDRSLIDPAGQEGWPLTSWPTFYFINDEMVLNTSLRGFSSTYIDMLIEDTMNN